MKVLYIAPYKDGTGWSHSAISNILSLDAANIDVVPRAIKLNTINSEVPERVLELESKSDKGCDIVIQNSLPHHFVYNGNFKKNIGCYFTETSHFRNSQWPEFINTMDEAWVPCVDNLMSSINSGVNIPIKIINVACDTSKYTRKYKPLDIPHLNGKYVFYWIGEFNRRKNLLALLKAYHLTFKPDEPVELVLKVSVPGMPPEKTFDFVANVCNELKSSLKLYKDKSTYLGETIITKRLKEDELSSLHQMCDCYVAPSFGEGWNIPLFDAMGFGKMLIASNTGGHKEFLNSSSLIETIKEHVHGMTDTPFGDLYVGNEQWDAIDVNSLCSRMRYFFENRNSDVTKMLMGLNMNKAYEFSYQNIGNIMKQELLDE